MKLTACSRRLITMPANTMKVTISPMLMRSRWNSHVPNRMMERTVNVVDARVMTATTAHQDSTGNCAASNWLLTVFNAVTSCSTRAKLCTKAMLPSASEARSASPA